MLDRCHLNRLTRLQHNKRKRGCEQTHETTKGPEKGGRDHRLVIQGHARLDFSHLRGRSKQSNTGLKENMEKKLLMNTTRLDPEQNDLLSNTINLQRGPFLST